MLLRPDGDDAVIAVGQASHAWLSGQLARAWGNDAFPAPSPREEVCLGAEQHDVGMAEWDLAPALDPETGWPVPFFRVDRRTHLRLWTDAPRRLLTQSRYAALLVSLHGTGLYERFPPRTDDAEILAAVREYRHRQAELQAALAEELGATEDELRRNQALLAAWDDLSLALCQDQLPRTVPDVPSADGPVAIEARAVEAGGAPAAGDGLATEVRTTVALHPWPFGEDQVLVQAEGRRLVGRFASAEALHAALDAAAHVPLCIVLRPHR